MRRHDNTTHSQVGSYSKHLLEAYRNSRKLRYKSQETPAVYLGTSILGLFP